MKKGVTFEPKLEKAGAMSTGKEGRGVLSTKRTRAKAGRYKGVWGVDICWVEGTPKGRTPPGRDPQGNVDTLSPFCGNFSKAGQGG